MKTSICCRYSRLIAWILPAVIGAVLLTAAGCARAPEIPEVPRASNAIDGGKVVVTGALPQFAAEATPVSDGFLEELRWNDGTFTLYGKGWAPLDVRSDTVRLVLRDPFDRLRLEGAPDFTPRDRTDVAAAHPQKLGMLHAGFTFSLRLANLPESVRWTDTLELYCLDGDGPVYRLTRVDAPERRSWDRTADRFELALTYTAPVTKVGGKKNGNVDLCEPGSLPGTVRLSGWAAFDGQSPRSQLIVLLPASAAPASIVSAVWTPRPDVRAAVDPARPELERAGFDLLLRTNASVADLRQPEGLRLWSIDATRTTLELGTAALLSTP